MAKKAQLDQVRPVLNAVNETLEHVETFADSVEAVADKATNAVEHGLEKVADVVPEALDKTVHVAAEGTRKGVRALQSPRTMALMLAVGGVVLGASAGVGGYFLLKKKLEHKLRLEFETKLDTEIEGMRLFYDRRTKTGKFATPAAAAEELLENTKVAPSEYDKAVKAADALNEYSGDQPPPGIQDADPREGANHRTRYDRVKNKATAPVVVAAIDPEGFVEPVSIQVIEESIEQGMPVDPTVIDGWDQEAEEDSRRQEDPYIISHDEYMENAYEHNQNTLTYYVGDDILADEREVPIDDVDAVIGAENLKRFGHGSRDSSIVYVRNERIELDFEVTRNPGKYSEEVAHFQHSDSPRIRRGRKGDDG
jgi:hypothetical protein